MEYDYEFWRANCGKSGQEMTREYGGDGGNWRRKIRCARLKYPDLNWYTHGNTSKVIPQTKPNQKEYKTTVEIKPDGSYFSDRLIAINEEQLKDPDFLLEAHGFDVNAWELISAKNNIWNVYSKGDDGHDISTLYASKITVKPREVAFDLNVIIEQMQDVKPAKVKRASEPVRSECLEIPLFDMHFGVSTFEHYVNTLERTLSNIQRNSWSAILFPVGSDLFHNDNFRSTTARGTIVDKMNVGQAWHDAGTFYATLIEKAFERSINVHLIYVKGNHDESMSWTFCQWLAARYPHLECDLDIYERKIFTFGDICVGYTHGDKIVQDFDRMFLSEFPEFASAKVKEIHTAHRHHEQIIGKDHFGTMVRTLPTANRADAWTSDNGFVGTNKRFQLFEYEQTRLKSIIYV